MMRLVDESGELKMSLFEHLTELRSRLIRCVIAVVVLGAISLVIAKPIYRVLMAPVLAALPVEGRALVFTSGIEEINVLMRVGLYAGVFFATPVILWQIWGFVAPGLLPKEKGFAAPFVLLGSLAFMAGTAFCYFGLLPTMFQFLLNEGDSSELAARIEKGKFHEQDALRFLAIGEVDRAGALAKDASTALRAEGEGQADASKDTVPQEKLDLAGRIDGMGRLIDASILGFGADARPALRVAMDKRLAAADALTQGDFLGASRALEDAQTQLTGVAPSSAAELGNLWSLEKDLAYGKARYDTERWTRPMLTMNEQLSLVLLLELAFGIIFELPLVMALLAKLGLVKARWLIKYQRHAFILCVIAAAIITPTGDAVNLALMAGPMLLCYELGVLAAWIIERNREKSLAIQPAPPAG